MRATEWFRSLHIAEWFRGLHPLSKVAWVLLTLWAAFWLWFNIGSGIFEMAELGVMALLMHLVMPLAIIVALWVCWRWPLAGGVLLLVLAALMFWRFGWYDWTVTLILETPAIVIGLLLLGGALLSRRLRPAAR